MITKEQLKQIRGQRIKAIEDQDKLGVPITLGIDPVVMLALVNELEHHRTVTPQSRVSRESKNGSRVNL